MSIKNQELFRSAYRGHYRSILAYALRRTVDRVDAEDVAAETFVVAWRRIDKVPTAEPDQLAWLYAVARRTLANHHRGRVRLSRLNELLITVDRTDARTPDDVIADDSDVATALEALSDLGTTDREIILLAVWEELSIRDIATVMGISKPNVSVRLHRARRRLRDRFDIIVQERSPAGHQTLRRATGDREQESTG